MKTYLIIYKSKENGEIRSANLAPKIIKKDGKETTVDNAFLDKYVTEYKDDYQTVSYIEVSGELAEIITFLRKDRTRSINEHLTALKEISATLNDMQNDVYNTIGNIDRDFKKQLEKETREEE